MRCNDLHFPRFFGTAIKCEIARRFPRSVVKVGLHVQCKNISTVSGVQPWTSTDLNYHILIHNMWAVQILKRGIGKTRCKPMRNLAKIQMSPKRFRPPPPIFEYDESWPSKIWSTVNLGRTSVLFFYHFDYLKVNLDLEKTNQLGESSPNFIFAAVNLDSIVIEKKVNRVNLDLTIWLKRWTDRGKDLRWVGSRCPWSLSLKIVNMI